MKYQVKKAAGFGYVKLIRSGWSSTARSIKTISPHVRRHA
jgi:hypothetical protein